MSETADADREVSFGAWALLLNVHARLVQAIDEEVTGAGLLPIDWYDVLLALHRAPGQRLRLSDLADDVLFSRSGLTRLVDRIEAKGLLCRQRCPDDRRGAFAVLTEAGRKALAETWPAYRKQIETRFSDHLTAAQARAIHDGLMRVLEAFEGGSRQPLVPITVRGRSGSPESQPSQKRP